MKLKCPLCGNDMIVDVDLEEGQRVICATCEGVFDYKKEHTIVESQRSGLHAVICPHCGRRHEVDSAEFGKYLRCSVCNQTFVARDSSRRQVPTRIVLRKKIGNGVSTQLDAPPKGAGFLMKLWSCLAELVGGLIGLIVLLALIVVVVRWCPDIRDAIVRATGSGNGQKSVAEAVAMNKDNESRSGATASKNQFLEPDMNGMFGIRFGSICPSDVSVTKSDDGVLNSSLMPLKDTVLCFSRYAVTMLPVSRRICRIQGWGGFQSKDREGALEYFKGVIRLFSQRCGIPAELENDKTAVFHIGRKVFQFWYEIHSNGNVSLNALGVDELLDEQKSNESNVSLGLVWDDNGCVIGMLGHKLGERKSDFHQSGGSWRNLSIGGTRYSGNLPAPVATYFGSYNFSYSKSGLLYAISVEQRIDSRFNFSSNDVQKWLHELRCYLESKYALRFVMKERASVAVHGRRFDDFTMVQGEEDSDGLQKRPMVYLTVYPGKDDEYIIRLTVDFAKLMWVKN